MGGRLRLVVERQSVLGRRPVRHASNVTLFFFILYTSAEKKTFVSVLCACG